MPRASYIQWNDDDNTYDAVRFVLDQHAYLDLYNAISTKQLFAGKDVATSNQSLFLLLKDTKKQ